MFQLRHRDVSDAGEEPNLMVNEKKSGVFRREPFLESACFHSFRFCRWFVVVPFGTVNRNLSARQMGRKYLVAWFTIPIGYDWGKWSSGICDTSWQSPKKRT